MNTSSVLFKIPAILLILTSCVPVSQIKPLRGQSEAVCPVMSPIETFTAVHRIEMTQGRMGKTLAIGVVKALPRSGVLLMTTEGMVMFEAKVEGGQTEVMRALPPLDTSGFAEGLMADVAFLFLSPLGPPAERGLNEEGFPACRWQLKDDTLVETAIAPMGVARARLYGRGGILLKEALAWPPFTQGLPAQSRLRVYSPVDYTLDMTLIEAEKVD
jgi:hypothetical protein